MNKKTQIILLLFIVWNGFLIVPTVAGNVKKSKTESITISVNPDTDMYVNQSKDIILTPNVTYSITFITKGVHDLNIAPEGKFETSVGKDAIFTLGVNFNGTKYSDTGIWTPTKAGWYEYYCSYHVSTGMYGWIKVGDAGDKPATPLPGFNGFEVIFGILVLTGLMSIFSKRKLH